MCLVGQDNSGNITPHIVVSSYYCSISASSIMFHWYNSHTKNNISTTVYANKKSFVLFYSAQDGQSADELFHILSAFQTRVPKNTYPGLCALRSENTTWYYRILQSLARAANCTAVAGDRAWNSIRSIYSFAVVAQELKVWNTIARYTTDTAAYL